MSTKAKELRKAKNINKSLGLRVAAVYLRNRGYSVECALFILLGV